MKTVKIISGIMFVIAYISLAVAGFMDGLKEGLVSFGVLTILVSMLLVFTCALGFDNNKKDSL